LPNSERRGRTLPRPDLGPYLGKIERIDPIRLNGKVTEVIGLIITSEGPRVRLGEVCLIETQQGENVRAEVVGFRESKVLLMPLGEMNGIAPGAEVIATGNTLEVEVGDELLGRILGGLGQSIDGKGELGTGHFYPVYNNPPDPLLRSRIDQVLPTGVKAIDGFLTCGRGQRIGIFSGSGVGKSTLLGMIARNAEADVNVIALIGERGREVREFLEKDLGPGGLSRSVVVVATSDQAPLVRVRGALVATAIAEYFRDQGKDVLFMMDSVTRFAVAQREIGLAIGEPPTTRGYTPSVFALLPRLLERSGTSECGTITGLYTVLVEGDDMNEPIADAVRGILDGHIVLSRDLASRGHYPAIQVLGSVSRVMPDLITSSHSEAAQRVREILATYKKSEDLINIGAYVEGTNPQIDYAISYRDSVVEFLRQDVDQHYTYQEEIQQLLTLGVEAVE
jgi:flagellum-specific ATP synthase